MPQSGAGEVMQASHLEKHRMGEWVPDTGHCTIYTAGSLILLCSDGECALVLPSLSKKVFIFDFTGAHRRP